MQRSTLIAVQSYCYVFYPFMFMVYVMLYIICCLCFVLIYVVCTHKKEQDKINAGWRSIYFHFTYKKCYIRAVLSLIDNKKWLIKVNMLSYPAFSVPIYYVIITDKHSYMYIRIREHKKRKGSGYYFNKYIHVYE